MLSNLYPSVKKHLTRKLIKQEFAALIAQLTARPDGKNEDHPDFHADYALHGLLCAAATLMNAELVAHLRAAILAMASMLQKSRIDSLLDSLYAVCRPETRSGQREPAVAPDERPDRNPARLRACPSRGRPVESRYRRASGSTL